MNVKTLSLKKQLIRLASVVFGFPATVSLFSMYMAAGEISGTVFRDFNASGTRENTPTYQEPGVPGVIVKAYDAQGGVAATATTDAQGNYTLQGLSTGTFYRVEFTGLQEGDQYGALGASNGSAVQFVKTELNGTSGVDLGINYPAQYASSTNPRIATSAFIAGNPLGGHTGHNTSILWTIPFNANGDHSGTSELRRNVSSSAQLGAIWGLAYNKKAKML